MFHVSRQADYGLLLATALAAHYQEGYISLRSLAKERRLPYRFLAKIIIPLRHAGLVLAQEGVYGGYRLAHAPQSILVSEVLRALGEDFILVRCESRPQRCQSFCQCNSRGFWHELQFKINEILHHTTIADLVDQMSPSRKPNVNFRPLFTSNLKF